jgi:hypothetical protein
MLTLRNRLQASKHAAERSFVQKKSSNAPDSVHQDGAAAASAVPSTLPAASLVLSLLLALPLQKYEY